MVFSPIHSKGMLGFGRFFGGQHEFAFNDITHYRLPVNSLALNNHS